MIHKLLSGLLIFLLAQPVVAKPVQRYLPLSFNADSGQLRTSVCALVTELAYEESMWWKAGKNLDAPQRALKSVVEAIIRKDRQTLESLSTKTGNTDDKYRQQLDLMLKFGDYLNSMDAVYLYEIAPLVVAFARIHVDGKTGIASFVFVKHDATYSLLPSRPKAAGYEYLREWANSEWGVLNAAGAGYCSSEEIARTDHRVTVASARDPDIRVVMPVDMRLVSSLAKPITSGSPSRVIQIYSQMREAARKNDFARLITFVSPGDAKQLGSFASDPEVAGQRESLKQAFLDGEPIAIVDGGPLQVLYTRSPSGGAKVWYFTSRSDGDPQWANVSALTSLDPVFNSGPLFEAARTDPTFEKLKKQQ